MKKTLLLSLFFLLPVFLMGQDIFVGFDNESEADSTYRADNATDTTSNIELSLDSESYVSGSSSMRIDYKAQNSEGYGGFVKIEHVADTMAIYNWATHDSISFWYNNIIKQDLTGRVHLRFNIGDVSDAPIETMDASQTEFYYSFHYILDDEPGWNEIVIPLIKGTGNNMDGFNRTGWAGIEGNNELDPDKIKWFAFEFSIDAGAGGGGGEIASGSILIDQLALKGSKNALTNGGFEDGLTDWKSAQGGGYIEVKNTGAYAGDNYCEIGVNDMAWAVAYSDSLPAGPKQVWGLSAFMKDFSADDLGASYAALKLEAHAEDNGLIEQWEDIIPGVSREWAQ